MKRKLVVLSLTIFSTAVATEGQVSIGGSVGYLDRRLSVLDAVEHQAGVVGGADVVLGLNVVRVSLSAGGGKLSSKTTGTPDVDYSRLSGELAFAPAPWFSIYGGVNISAFVSAIGSQRWILPRIGAELRPAFASIPAEVYLRAAALVGASTNSPTGSSGGLTFRGGLVVGRGRLRFFADYNFERLNFDAAAAREEQRGEVKAGLRVNF